MSDGAQAFESQRPRLFWLAYRLLGSASEAEDAVQDAYLRLHAADVEAIASLPAWLTKAVTNLCLNRLTSARARREVYPGPWLPEPVLTDDRTLGRCVVPRICYRLSCCFSPDNAATIGIEPGGWRLSNSCSSMRPGIATERQTP